MVGVLTTMHATVIVPEFADLKPVIRIYKDDVCPPPLMQEAKGESPTQGKPNVELLEALGNSRSALLPPQAKLHTSRRREQDLTNFNTSADSD